MKLKDWLKAKKMSQASFARLINSDQAHISDLITGKCRPRLANIEFIEHVTKGEVKVTDWIVVVKEPRRKKNA